MRRPADPAPVLRTLLVAALVGLVGSGALVGSTSARFKASTGAEWTADTRAACSPTNPFPATLAAPATMPTLWWRFNLTTGATTVTDQSGHGNSGRVRRTGLTFGTANAGLIPCDSTYAMRQPGAAASNGFVSATTARPAPASYTVSTWIRTSALTGGRVVGFGNSATGGSVTQDRALLLDLAGRPVFQVRTSTGNLLLSGPTSVSDGALHWLTATFNGSVAKLYVDGALVATSLPIVPAAAYSGVWRAGWDQNVATLIPGSRNQADAVQDEIAIWEGRVLSGSEISDLWRSNHW
jgi:hypothetical protein